MTRLLSMGLLSLVVGCAPSAVDMPSDTDPDGDGLSNDEEYALGTDPESADSDGDGFTDFEENEEGSDPLDSADYPGWEEDIAPHWPTALCDPEPEASGLNQVGMIAENVKGINQYGEQTELYDYCDMAVLMMIGGFT